jgi:hypothetical protein
MGSWDEDFLSQENQTQSRWKNEEESRDRFGGTL